VLSIRKEIKITCIRSKYGGRKMIQKIMFPTIFIFTFSNPTFAQGIGDVFSGSGETVYGDNIVYVNIYDADGTASDNGFLTDCQVFDKKN
jgi:hypothetical protein